MKQQFADFCRDYKCALPYIVLFLASFFLPAASHRVVFYLSVPFLVYNLWLLRENLKDYLFAKSFGIFVAYLLYFAATFFWSENQGFEEGIKLLRNEIGIFLFVFSLAVIIPTIRFSPRTPFYFAAICLVMSAITALVYYGFEGKSIAKRIVGLGRYQNPIHYSFLLSYAIFAVISLGFTSDRRQNILKILTIVGCLILIFLSQTRSTFVGLAFCVGMLVFMGHKRLGLILGGLLILCAAAVFSIWDFSFLNIGQRMDAYRFDIWHDAISGILAKPWFGNGITTTPHFFEEYDQQGWKSTHNAFLGHAYTGGIVGFILYIAMLGNMIRVGVARYFREKQLDGKIGFLTSFYCLTFCFIFFSSLFNFTVYIVNVHIQWLMFWMPFALSLYIEADNIRQARAVQRA